MSAGHMNKPPRTSLDPAKGVTPSHTRVEGLWKDQSVMKLLARYKACPWTEGPCHGLDMGWTADCMKVSWNDNRTV